MTEFPVKRNDSFSQHLLPHVIDIVALSLAHWLQFDTKQGQIQMVPWNITDP